MICCKESWYSYTCTCNDILHVQEIWTNHVFLDWCITCSFYNIRCKYTFYYNTYVSFSIILEPADPPTILSVYPKPTSIHVTWQEPVYINGPLIAYRLTLIEANGPEPPKIKNVIPEGTKVLTDIFTSLQPATDYILKISAWNEYGLGPEVRTEVLTTKLTIGRLRNFLYSHVRVSDTLYQNILTNMCQKGNCNLLTF